MPNKPERAEVEKEVASIFAGLAEFSCIPGKRDKYGRIWPQNFEVCAECGQPDNCGDCNHARLSDDEYLSLLGAELWQR